MLKGKISIIIPVYNTETYIERCVRSILKQTYENLEIICVNDGSTDKSGEILDALAREDARVVVVHKKNAGVSAARNEALCHATGDYITFVDSDDYIDERMYEKMLSKLMQEDADIVTCGYSFDYAGDIRSAGNLQPVPESAMPTRDFLQYIYERDVYKGVAGYLWTRIVKREVIFEGLAYPQIIFCEQFGVAEDVVFVAEITARAKKMVYLNETLYYYFQRGDSVTRDYKTQLETLQWPLAYEKIIRVYTEKGWMEILNIIERMYVYTCGKMLELAIEYKDTEKAEILRDKIKNKLPVYVETNLEHLDRVKWVVELMMHEI